VDLHAAIVDIIALRIIIVTQILRIPLLFVLVLLVYSAITLTNLRVSHVQHLKQPVELHAVILAILATLILTVTQHRLPMGAPMYVFSNLQYPNIGNQSNKALHLDMFISPNRLRINMLRRR
jgi:hypothetical protein